MVDAMPEVASSMPKCNQRKLQFQIRCSNTKPGQAVYIVGSATDLGAWDPNKGVACITTPQSYPLWTSANITIQPSIQRLDFKVVVRTPNHAESTVKWEDGPNKFLELPASQACSQLIIVFCEFGKPPVHMELCAEVAASLVSDDHEDKGPLRKHQHTTANPMLDDHQDHVFDPGEREEEFGRQTSEAEFSRRRNTSRHLVTDSQGSFDLEMSRTPSLMLIDTKELEDAAKQKDIELIELERERLNRVQRRVRSCSLLDEMKTITEYSDPSRTILLQAFNWESWRTGAGDWYGVVSSNVDVFVQSGITDVWLPPCSQSVAPQGYLPSQLFNLDASRYGSQASLQQLLRTLHGVDIRGVADIVINHRCGDRQDSQGRWNVFTSGMKTRASLTGVCDWQGWAVTLGDQYSDGSGQNRPANLDAKFDAAPDIDHANLAVQQSISVWLRWLRLEVGFDAWRFDFVKGYAPTFIGTYCQKSEPAWAVGELWTDMKYDNRGLMHNQDGHRQALCNWINGTGKAAAAFDFTTKGILQEAVRNCEYWRLRDSSGKPPGLLGWWPSKAVTFIDNHDTGSTQKHWPFPSEKVLIGYAYTLTHPGIPCIFWDHLIEWSAGCRQAITDLTRARRDSGIPVDAEVRILQADGDLYLAEIGNPPSLRVALGPRNAERPDKSYWSDAARGTDWRVWVHRVDTAST